MLHALDFKERTRIRRIVYAKPTILLVFVLSLVSLNGAWGMYQKSKEATQNRDKAVAETAALSVHEAALHADITRLSSYRGQEEAIRNRFMVAKEGEKVIIISEQDGATSHSVTVNDNGVSNSLVNQLKAAIGLSGN